MLFDPGEGTQRQMTFAGVSASDITKIFITHFHGDHCLGLPGIWQRLSLERVAHTVQLFYPASGQRYVENLRDASIFHNTARVEEHAVKEAGIIYDCPNFWIEAHRLDHSVESWGYRIQEKDGLTMLPDKLEALGVRGQDIGRLIKEGSLNLNGKTIALESVSVRKKGQSMAFIMDTRLCDAAYHLAREADLLVCESTYLESETMDAVAHGHLTAAQAAEIAREARADLLALTHFSQRYKAVEDFAAEAQALHPKAVAMKDGDRIELPKRR
jgi:ribonuclease Z